MNKTELINLALSKWGHDKQANQAIEELNELAVAINHFRRELSEQNEHDLIEEIADVELMLDQTKQMWDINPEYIGGFKREKLQRLAKNLGTTYEEYPILEKI